MPQRTSDSPSRAAFVAALFMLTTGCGASMIPNTDVEDNAENREIIEFMESYRHAVEDRNIGKLLKLASPDYYDDSGTPNAEDDVDYESLAQKLATWKERLIKVRYEIRYRRVTRVRERIFVDFTYTGSFQLKTVEGEHAVRRLEDNRIVLAEKDDSFEIVSGM